MAFLAFERSSDQGRQTRLLVAFYLLMGLATLAKGLIGVVLPGGIILCYILCTRRFDLLRRMKLWWGIPLYLAVTAPWFVVVSFRNPDFAWYFFVREHFLRYVTSTHRRSGSPFYYIPIMLGGFLPFVGYLFPAVLGPLRRIWKTRFREPSPDLFLVIWASTILAFFSVSNSKLPFYILSVFPPLALLVGRYIVHKEQEWAGQGLFPRVHWLGIVGCAVPGILFALSPLVFPQIDSTRDFDALPYTVPSSVAMLVILGIGCRLRRGDRTGLTPFLFAAFASLMLGGMLLTQDIISTRKTARPIAEAINARARPEEVVVHLGGYYQTMGFYTKRRAVVVGNSRELRFGRTRARDEKDWFWSVDRLLQAWRSDRRVWAIVKIKRLEGRKDLREGLRPFYEVERAGVFMLLTNKPIRNERTAAADKRTPQGQ